MKEHMENKKVESTEILNLNIESIATSIHSFWQNNVNQLKQVIVQKRQGQNQRMMRVNK